MRWRHRPVQDVGGLNAVVSIGIEHQHALEALPRIGGADPLGALKAVAVDVAVDVLRACAWAWWVALGSLTCCASAAMWACAWGCPGAAPTRPRFGFCGPLALQGLAPGGLGLGVKVVGVRDAGGAKEQPV